jgi:hypothetical protein
MGAGHGKPLKGNSKGGKFSYQTPATSIRRSEFLLVAIDPCATQYLVQSASSTTAGKVALDVVL